MMSSVFNSGGTDKVEMIVFCTNVFNVEQPPLVVVIRIAMTHVVESIMLLREVPNKVNRRGPKTEPCGTPEFGLVDEKVQEL